MAAGGTRVVGAIFGADWFVENVQRIIRVPLLDDGHVFYVWLGGWIVGAVKEL